MNSQIVWMIIGMGLATYIPRMIPLVILQKLQLPVFLQNTCKTSLMRFLVHSYSQAYFLFMRTSGSGLLVRRLLLPLPLFSRMLLLLS